jgi:rubrerythrin
MEYAIGDGSSTLCHECVTAGCSAGEYTECRAVADSESDVCVSCGVIYETTVADGQCSSCKAVR